MRRCLRGADGQRTNGFRDKVDNTVLVLNAAPDLNKFGIENLVTILVIEIGLDDDARVAGFILQRHEDESLRCARTLTRNHRTCGSCGRAMAQGFQFRCRLDSAVV